MIKDAILNVRERILRACSKISKDPESITIVAVSKGRSPEQIKEVIEAGITDIGENRVEETFAKCNELQTPNSELRTIRWHMVGHLQTNKVKDAVKIFDLIQSVDSLHLAREIDRQAAKINKIQDILIEVKTSPEATKFGVKPDELEEVIKEMVKLKNINIIGLMTIAPIVDNPEKTRPYFRMLRDLKGKINELRTPDSSRPCRDPDLSGKLQTLSMGMTDDFEVAIEEGSNMLRLGRAIFSRQ